MSDNNQDTTLTNLFAQEHDTGITRPLAPWNRADAKQEAAMEAYYTLLANKAEIQTSGITNPAAALYLNDKTNYAFTIYDASKLTPQEAAPEGKKVIIDVNPLNL